MSAIAWETSHVYEPGGSGQTCQRCGMSDEHPCHWQPTSGTNGRREPIGAPTTQDGEAMILAVYYWLIVVGSCVASLIVVGVLAWAIGELLAGGRERRRHGA